MNQTLLAMATALPLATLAATPFALAPSAQAPIVSAAEKADGFVPLFNGTSLTGWQVISLAQNAQPVGSWYVRDGVLSNDKDRGENWLATESAYTNFVLRLEYRPAGDTTDSGIFFRSGPTGYPSFTGMEFEIKGNDSGSAPTVRSTSAIYGAVAPTKVASKVAGEWNTVEVTVTGRRLKAVWNGETIHDINLDDPAYANAQRGALSARLPAGLIGFQAHLNGTPVEFRNVRIKVLPAAN
jgi:hypothetical protein